MSAQRIAVLVPCRNEAVAVASVVRDFRAALPDATIYVYDNASTDDTAAVARAAGAIVRTEPVPGKGGVVRRMFADVDADVYLMVDGDATYDARSAPALLAPILEQYVDIVIGVREHEDAAAYRRGHELGNRAFNALLGMLFGRQPADMLSGYRALSRRFVKSFPTQARFFEIETEMTVHALEMRVPAVEIVTPYFKRPEGSLSKLSTWGDGLHILRYMLKLFRDVKPLVFFCWIAAVLGLTGLLLGGSVVIEYMQTRAVPRFPTAILATGLVLLASLSFACGMILESVARGRLEAKRLAYLAQPVPRGPEDGP